MYGWWEIHSKSLSNLLKGNTKPYVYTLLLMNGFFRPIFTSEFHMLRKLGLVGGEREKVTVVGNLCTPLDQYYKDYY